MTDPADDETTMPDEESHEPDADAEEATGSEGEEDTEAETTGLQEGDFIRLSYTARTADTDQLVDTTDAEIAEEEGVGDQGEFEPRTIALGSGHLFASVEEEIVGGEVGEGGSITIPPAEAFGEYDDSEVETVAASKIGEDDRYPGARVQLDGRQGTLETIIGGRARVDFNHPLAGEEITYEYEVLEAVDDELEQAEGMLGMFLDVELAMHIEDDEVEETSVEQPEDEEGDPETVTETVEKRTLYIEATPQLAMNQQWMFQKQQIAQEIIDKTELDRLVIEEVLDGAGGMMGGMGGMGGAMPAGGDEADIEAALEEADIDAEEIAEEL